MDAKNSKLRLQTLLGRQKIKSQKKETSVLFDECIAELGDETIIFSNERTSEIYRLFKCEFKFTFYGRIDWSLYEYEEIDINTLRNFYADNDDICYVIWSHGSDAVIQANINKVLEHLDEVTAVSPDVWLFKENEYLVELFHDGIIRRTSKKD